MPRDVSNFRTNAHLVACRSMLKTTAWRLDELPHVAHCSAMDAPSASSVPAAAAAVLLLPLERPLLAFAAATAFATEVCDTTVEAF